jgi:hypothetical protein
VALLNSILFLSFQIFQAPTITTSINMGYVHCVLPCSIIYHLLPIIDQPRFKVAQHSRLNWQWNTKCSTISSRGELHMRRLYPKFETNFLRLSSCTLLELCIEISIKWSWLQQ